MNLLCRRCNVFTTTSLGFICPMCGDKVTQATITELRDEAESLVAHIKGEIERFHARNPGVQLLISHTRDEGPNTIRGVYWPRDLVEYELKVLPTS